MPSKKPVYLLRDISEAIEMIEGFVSGMDFDAFRQDPKTVAAVERKLLVISEAAVRLGEHAVALCPDQPWHEIRATGNWLRHAYERIDLETVWGTIQDDLPPPQSGCPSRAGVAFGRPGRATRLMRRPEPTR